MEPFVQDPDFVLYNADALTALRELPDESVHCVLTSPPYWGLRDYGTRSWEGGLEDCEHEASERYFTESTAAVSSAGAFSKPGAENAARLKAGRWRESGTCTKCGALLIDAQLGLEAKPADYVAALVAVFREVRRVLRADGTCWLNLGDSYAQGSKGNSGEIRPGDKQGSNAGSLATRRGEALGPNRNGGTTGYVKPKDLIGIPWRVAFALQDDGWWLRSDIVWSKPNPMPESVTDRPTKAHEYVFLLAKGQWNARVVELANLDSEVVHLNDDGCFQPPRMWSTRLSVLLASAILDCSKGQDEFGLPTLDPQEWKQLRDRLCGARVGDLPVEHRASVHAARFLASDVPAKEFLRELQSLGITLTDAKHLVIAGGATEVSLPPTVYAYGDRAVAIEYPGEVRKFDFAHGVIVTERPTKCSYFFDQEAVREPFEAKPQQRLTALREQPLAAARRAAGVEQGDPQGGTHESRFAVQRETLDGSSPPEPAPYRSGNHERKSPAERDADLGKGAQASSIPWEDNGNGRNIRTVWEIATQSVSEAHFATFPEALVDRIVKAGTSEHGCCPSCGAPWIRRTERESYITRPTTGSETQKHKVGEQGANGLERVGGHVAVAVATVGWQPSCSCEPAEPGPATVLDPFGGSGTTALVARRLGRKSILIELNEDYCRMAARRLQQLSLLA